MKIKITINEKQIKVWQTACIFGLLLISISCKKNVSVPAPVTSINADNVFQTKGTAVSAMNEIYISIDNSMTGLGSFGGLYIACGLEADELTLFASNSFPANVFYTNSLTSKVNPIWQSYVEIYAANAVIAGVSSSKYLTKQVKNQLVGEAKFMRAMFYFYLVNCYGDVPLAVTTDPAINAKLSRSSKSDVYLQIVQDLKEAQELLSDDYLSGDMQGITTERVRPTKWAATALLARTYLYMGKYQDAITQSTSVIDNNAKFSLTDLNSVFLKNSKETIWAIQSIQSGGNYSNTGEGYLFILPSGGPSQLNYVYLSQQLNDAFEPGDARKSSWTNSVTVNGKNYPYAYKYKVGGGRNNPVSEYEVVLRLGEQYLIRAEAYARLGGSNITNSLADLNAIRSRARAAVSVNIPNPLPAISPTLSQVQLYRAIEHERQVELFTEWGHRWLDLKRVPGFDNPAISRADEIMPAVTQLKGGAWQSYQQLWPIPITDIQLDPNLNQNPGY